MSKKIHVLSQGGNGVSGVLLQWRPCQKTSRFASILAPSVKICWISHLIDCSDYHHFHRYRGWHHYHSYYQGDYGLQLPQYRVLSEAIKVSRTVMLLPINLIMPMLYYDIILCIISLLLLLGDEGNDHRDILIKELEQLHHE